MRPEDKILPMTSWSHSVSVYGYDALPFLPAYEGYVVESRDRTDRFLWDMRRLVADRIAYDYVGGLRDISHKIRVTDMA